MSTWAGVRSLTFGQGLKYGSHMVGLPQRESTFAGCDTNFQRVLKLLSDADVLLPNAGG